MRNAKRETYRVEVTENNGETLRGFLSREDDENPNNNMAVREFDDPDEAGDAIRDTLRENPEETELEYWIINDLGAGFGCAKHDGQRWIYDF